MPADTAGPAPGPRAEDVDLAAEMERLPFFMTEAPLAKDGAETDNVALEALRSLVYEGTPEEIAENLRIQANSCFQRKAFREALNFYSQALNEVGDNLSPDSRRTLLANRAAANLELANYGACIRDCGDVLRISPAHDATTRKALFRTSRALVALDRLDDAAAALSALRSIGPDPSASAETAVVALQAKVEKLRCARAEVIARRKAEQERVRAAATQLKQALLDLNVILPAAWTAQSAASAAPTDVKPPRLATIDPPVLSFPVFVLRPLHEPPTRDMILDWRDDATFGEQLDGNYGDELTDSDFFAVTSDSRVLKVGRKLTVRTLAKAARKGEHGVPLVAGWCLEFYVVPRARAASWAEQMKAHK